MKHLHRWHRATATGIGAVLVVGSLGSVAAASPTPAPIALVAESDLALDDPATDTGSSTLAETRLEQRDLSADSADDDSTDSTDSLDSADDDSDDSDDSADSTDSLDSDDSDDSADSTDSLDSADDDSIDSTDSVDSIDSDDSIDSTDDGVPAGPFPDVAGDSVHAASIARLAELQITTGDLDGSFGPAELVTRGQFASMLARALRLDPVDGQRFADVRPDNVHAANINAVAAAGITTGVTDTTFEPDQLIRRDQLASMLIRGLESETS